MYSKEVVAALAELAKENELYQELWDNLQEMKQNNPDGYDAFIGDIVLYDVQNKEELEEYLMNL